MKRFITKGPKYLERFAEKLSPKKKIEWKGKVKSSSGNHRFRIKYFGDLLKSLIRQTEELPQLIVLEDIETQEEIVVFDGGRHGYNAMFTDEYDQEELEDRQLATYRVNEDEVFEVEVSVHYNIDYDDPEEDFIDELDAFNQMEVFNGEKLLFDDVKRNGFDWLGITAINPQGRKIKVAAEELA